MVLSAALKATVTPPVSAAVLGPWGTETALVASPSTWTSGSPEATESPEAFAVVQPVNELPDVPVQVMTEPEGEVALRSSNWPAPTVSAPVLGELTEMVAPLPPVVGTDDPAEAKVSGSTPTDSTAGRAETGLGEVRLRECPNNPTPRLSPAGRLTVYR